MNINKPIAMLQKRASVLRVLGLSMIVISFAVFIYFTRVQEKSIEKQVETIQAKDVEIEKKDAVITEVHASKTRTDGLTAIVNEYLRLRAAHDADGLDNLYAQKLDFYFKNLKNADKSLVKDSDKQYWSKNPKDKFTLSDDPQILITGDTAQAIVKGKQCRTETTCVEVITEINFDNLDKIKSVRSYFAK